MLESRYWEETNKRDYYFSLCEPLVCLFPVQGTKLTFLARSHLAPKFSKVVAKAKKLGAIKKKR